MDERDTSEKIPVQLPAPSTDRYVTVKSSDGGLLDFPNAIAVARDGVLLIVPWNAPRSIPIQGYAPGMWLGFKHQGDYTTPARRTRPAEEPFAVDQLNRTYENKLAQIAERQGVTTWPRGTRVEPELSSDDTAFWAPETPRRRRSIWPWR